MIQIHETDIEALINERLASGRFSSIEEVLRQALQDAPLPKPSVPDQSGLTGAAIVAAFQRCPDPNFTIEREPYYPPISPPLEF